ncbi:MAG: (Fe-S)-binding protein [Planctomycetes bacterium]|jgi:hypothetical protein|nr:(Fe-S)-binding protein [Planctomycetota bacterium]
MPLPTAPVLGILADNLRLRGSVMPLSRKKATGWADGLDLPRGGKTVLYTGHLYQLMPSIAALTSKLERFEDSLLNRAMGIGRAVNRKINLSSLMGREDRKVREVCEERLRNIARLVKAAGVNYGYLYEEELYSGALVYDQGLDSTFAEHAAKVAEVFRRNGVETAITVDPHTTHVLRSIFPGIVSDFTLKVRSYLEVLADSPAVPVRPLDLDVAIHDSCVYARGENLVREPRALLERAGARIREPESHGRKTLCCGGPIESLFPARAKAICARRLDELAAAAHHVVAMCPICLMNLEHGAEGRDLTVRDICEPLAESFCGE